MNNQFNQINQNIKKTTKPFYKDKLFIAFMIFTGFILLWILIIGEPENTDNKINENLSLNKIDYSGQRKVLIEGFSTYYLGTSSPKITIVWFSDFACEYCREGFLTIREISEKYKESVKFIYRDRPAFANSIDFALSARCAGEQGRFWAMHDKLFQLKDEELITDKDFLANLAQKAGVIDKGKFLDCLNSQKYLNLIKKDLSDSQELKISGTPTFFVQGVEISGVPPLKDFEDIIDKLLISN
jgi:predicted DsbA family dithiol-disulfide isomerase